MSEPRRRRAGTRRRPPFSLAGSDVLAGRKAKLELPIARLMSGTPVALPVQVLHGRHDGPIIWLSAAIHGDEICGVEIIRRVLTQLEPSSLRGTVVAVPIVNVHGFNAGDRYLPDRRDLNRAFPGSARGSLAARIAHLMMSEIVARCTVGIDLHTGSDHRINLPQVRADLDDPETLELARAFGAPLALHSRTRNGSLRQAATEAGATVLLFEGGEADRFDGRAIGEGTDGVLRVLGARGMIDSPPPARTPTRFSRSSKWVRASSSGILHLEAQLGDEIRAGERLATIHDAFGKRRGTVRARVGGVIAGHTQRPLVNRGDAIAHIAEVIAPPGP
jgi:predicted deacylase